MNDYRIFVGAFPEGDLADRIQAVRLQARRQNGAHHCSARDYGRNVLAQWSAYAGE